MQIKRLKLTNAFQHASMEINFQPFQAIVGANGSGKSNVIESIGLALTGAMTLPGKLESAVKEGQEKGKIEMDLDSEGELVELVSHLGKSSRSLTRGTLKIGKSAEVLEYLERQVLRTPFNIVNSSSIIRQGQLDAGLFDTQAKRTEAFMRMAGLSDIEKKRQQLADAKAAVTVPMLSFSVDDAANKIKELEDYLAKVWAEKTAIPVTDGAVLTTYQTFIAMTTQVEKAKIELAATEKSFTEAEQLVRETKALSNTQRAELQKHTQNEELVRPQVDQAKIRIANFARAQKDWDKKAGLVLGLQEYKTKQEQLKSPGDYKGVDPAELQPILAELGMKITDELTTIDAFSKPTAECPTCRRPCTIQEAESIISRAKASLVEMQGLEQETKTTCAEAIIAKADWEKAVKAYDNERSRLVMIIESQQRSLDELKDVIQPKADSVSHDEGIVKHYADLVSALNNARIAEREAGDLLNEAINSMSALGAKIGELRKQAEVQVPGTGGVMSLASAKAFVSDHETRLKKLSELDGVIQGTQKQLRDEKTRLEKLKEETEKAKTLVQYTEYLEFARTALHRDNFPSGKVKEFVDRMLVSANMYLDAMQAGFSVSYHKDDGFIAFFPHDRKHMRADRLSGGEKVTFALAFRFAVNDIHTDTGFLILDEPTVWLDDKHIDYVINALALVKTKIVPRVQLIIVTHDEKLAAVADSVFEVTK